MGAWVTHPWLLVTVFAALCWYALGLRRQRREGRLSTGADRLRPLAFAASMAVLAFALTSPLDAWAERSFPVHMTQHLSLMLVAAPLLAWARPVLTGLWAFPLRERRRIGRERNRLGVLRGVYEFLMRPMVAWSLASAALWVWHIPAAFDAAWSHEWVHTSEHLCFLLTSVAFWTLAMPPYRGEVHGAGVALVMVSLFALHSGLLGALLTFAGSPLYLSYAEPAFGLTPLQAQQLAGLIMWIPASFAYLLAAALLFVDWLGAATPRGSRERRVTS